MYMEFSRCDLNISRDFPKVAIHKRKYTSLTFAMSRLTSAAGATVSANIARFAYSSTYRAVYQLACAATATARSQVVISPTTAHRAAIYLRRRRRWWWWLRSSRRRSWASWSMLVAGGHYGYFDGLCDGEYRWDE